MRTGRSLTVYQSLLPAGGVCSQRGVSGLGEGVSAPGGCLLRGGLLPLLWGGVSAPGGGVSQHVLRQTPYVNRITHTCKNITLAQLCCGR